MDVGGVLPESDTSERVRNRCLSVLDGEVHEFGFEFEDRFFDAWAVPVTDESGAVFAGMIMTQDVTPRIERERELEHQREQLTAVNNLHDIVQDVTDAVIEQSTRTEIEEIVCERLAESDSYLFAWFSEVDPKTRSVEPKVEAGVDGYLEEISLSTNPDEPTGRGPTGRAIQTQEIQVVQNVFENRDFQPWREAAEKYGFQSSAAIPVTYEGTTYGVLGLYADRADAFTDAERSVISQIGEVVGHAIAALERKRVLMSDEVLELEVRVNDVSEAFGISADVDGTVDIDQVVPIDDGTFLEYGTATGNGMAAIEAAVASDRLPQWESVSVLESTNDETRFEIRFSKAPVLSTVAAHGGDFRQARLQDGDFYMRVHLPPSADVRQIVDSVVEIYPNMEMVSQRHLTRDRRSSQLRGALFEGLTDRQQTAIEAAYHAGFFEWPRNKTGEEVAASMGVSPPTFHQHVRKGLRKLLETAIETA
jgi:predicted DNA binding protein